MPNSMTYPRLALLAVSVFALGCAMPAARAGDFSGGDPRGWIVTLGGYGVYKPDYLGSDDHELGFKPIFNIRREGSREWLALPDDSAGFALIETVTFRAGPAFNFEWERDSSDNKALAGLPDVDFTFEAGVFLEYWPVESLRTRLELLQGLGGHEGFVANLSADALWRPSERWLLTLGPRLTVVSDNYADAYFSTPGFDAEGGLLSVGAGVSATYSVTPQFDFKFYAEYDRLLGDAADSPIVDPLGSPDQFTIGVGAAYKFTVRR